MVHRFMILVCVAALSAQASAQTSHVVQSPSLQLTFDGSDPSRITALRLQGRPENWLRESGALYEIAGSEALQAKLAAHALDTGEIQLTLELTNPTSQAVKVDVSFPLLRHLGGGAAGSDPLAYCFPRQAAVIDDQPVALSELYSGRFPLQFVDVFGPDGGVYLMTCDTDLHRKRYFLDKAQKVSMGAQYLGQVIAPGRTLRLPPARLGAHAGDWHAALAAYRRWVAVWHRPTAPRKRWWQHVFNFRQVFLHPNMDMGGLHNAADGSLRLQQAVRADAAIFGGVDYVHLFDWSQSPRWGRVGDYDPWDDLPRDKFVEELQAMQSGGMRIGLYFEGYLISPNSRAGQAHGNDWQMLNAEQGRYDPFGSGDFYACPAVGAWREHLTQAVRRAAAQTGADGYYIDQLGFGYQYPCFNPAHHHPIPSNQPRAEAELTQRIRAALPNDKVLYTEQTPVDVTTQYQDGSFSYTLLHARGGGRPVPIDLARFALPDFKIIQILHGDGPIGDDLQGVQLAFFNGEGLWLAGPGEQAKWFSPQVLKLIVRTHGVLRRYADAFAGDLVEPLVPTLQPGVYANRFDGDGRTVWTLYNASQKRIADPVLRVAHTPRARYHDAWNDRPLTPDVIHDQAALTLDLAPGAAGCIVQQR